MSCARACAIYPAVVHRPVTDPVSMGPPPISTQAGSDLVAAESLPWGPAFKVSLIEHSFLARVRPAPVKVATAGPPLKGAGRTLVSRPYG